MSPLLASVLERRGCVSLGYLLQSLLQYKKLQARINIAGVYFVQLMKPKFWALDSMAHDLAICLNFNFL